MTKTWSDYFEESMASPPAMPVPASLYTSAAVAISSIGALYNALKITVAAKDAITVAQLIAVARTMSLGTAIGAATLGELASMAGGVLASYYIGRLLGAAIYATDEAYLGWSDKLIDWLTAENDLENIRTQASSYNVRSSYVSRMDFQKSADRKFTQLVADIGSGGAPPTLVAGWPTRRTVV
ncbi:MAG: hypothetical protein GC201_15715 [Alphaproteobacteria bacterium]|nr:hypothetical protein [Alphaproteobacteria bacterium]